MSTATVNSVAMADIATINGQTVPSGGGGGYATSTTGLLLWGADGAPSQTFPADYYVGGTFPESYALWNPPAGRHVTKIVTGRRITGVLLDNGDLYTVGTSSQAYLGRTTTPGPYDELHVSLTNVSTFAQHSGGFVAIKNDGTLWICGQLTGILPGHSPSYYYYQWAQYGTDTDWVDVVAYWNYPYATFYIKGASGSQRVLSSGYNNYGITGLGLSSGTTSTPTNMKVNSTTDLTANIVKIAVGANAFGCIDDQGRLYTCGQNTYGRTGQGTTSGNTVYITQVGTDTNWDSFYPSAMGSFAIKTTGAAYISTQNSTYFSWTSGNATYNNTLDLTTQLGTDTDYEEFVIYSALNSWTSLHRGIMAKKSGAWYINALNDAWNGSAGNVTSSQGVWYAMTGSSINVPLSTSVTVATVHQFLDNGNTQNPMGILISAY